MGKGSLGIKLQMIFFCKGAIVEITGSVFIVLKNKTFVKATVIWQFVAMEHVLWIQIVKDNVSVLKVVQISYPYLSTLLV